ncbi:terminase large subunit [Shewanella algae]|uniref:terminase large subunit n=1 Tax=Shewanella algae TaxID=38313 RepID=UPI003003F75F
MMNNNELSKLSKYDHASNTPDLKCKIANESIRGDYFQGWQAADQYAFDVLNESILTNRYVKLAAKRYFEFRENPEYYLDKRAVDLIILISNGLRHVKGPIAGQPLKLMSWMIFSIACIYGFRYKSTKRLVTNKAYIFVARGNAKSTLLSVLAVYGLLCNPNGSPLTVSAARNREQARIVFTDCRKMILGAHKSIRDKFIVEEHKIKCKTNGGLFYPVSSDAGNMNGLRTTQVLIDELHVNRNTDVQTTLETGMASSKDAVMFMISTAGENVPTNPAIIEQQIGRNVVEGNVNLPNYFYLEYSLDERDDWQDSSTWIKANPSLGHSVFEHILEQTCNEAKTTPSKRVQFMTKHCNVFYSGGEDSFIDQNDYDQSVTPFNWESVSKKHDYKCYIGIDLAFQDDLCSVAYLFEHNKTKKRILTTRSFVTTGMIKKSSEFMAKLYGSLTDGEHLIRYNGLTQDHDYILNDLVNQIKTYGLDVILIGYDPASGGTQFATNLSKQHNEYREDDNLLTVKQGYGLSDAALLFQSDLVGGSLQLDNNDQTLKYCLNNVKVIQGQNNSIKLDRAKGENKTVKIDAAIASVIAYRMVIYNQKYNNESVYEKRDILYL